MSRVRLRTGPATLFGALLVVALIVCLPMRLVLGWIGLGDQGLSARSVSGSVWDGRLDDARFGDLPLGSLDASLSPAAVLVGRARVAIADGSGAIHGALVLSRHGQGVDDLTAALPTGRAFAPLPVTRLMLENVTIRFEDSACVRAEGRVRAILVGEAAGIALPSELSGTARCEGEALVLPLASQSGAESIVMRISATGRYSAALKLTPADPAAAERLGATGFVPGPGGYRLSIEGSF